MKKFVLVGAIALGSLLALMAQPADAQMFGRLRNRGGGRTYYSGSYYAPYNYGYSPNSYSYGWPSAYNDTSPYSYSADQYRLGSLTPAAWDVANPQYSAADRNRMTYRSFYAPNDTSDSAANIRVVVPAPDARVTFDDSATEQTGTDRWFASPPLDPNKEYSYTVRATWTENGREKNLSKDVKVKAGRTSMADFRDNRETRDTRDETLPLPRDKDRKDDKRDDLKNDKRTDRPDKPD
jgi:uncharacterized protein (TIGR03000 family)